MEFNVCVSIQIVLALLVTPEIDATVRCLECTDMPHPQDCSVTTECPSFDHCFVEMFITSGGLTLYNSGCMSAQACANNVGKRHRQPLVPSRQQRSQDITLCKECCTGEFCNNQGCGTQASKQPDRGPVCFECPFQATADSCRDIVTCDLSEFCMIEHAASQIPGVLATKCATQKQCSTLNSQLPHLNTNSFNTCLKCCSDDYCNDDCHGNTASSISKNTSSLIPILSITVTTTTQSVMMPTHPSTTLHAQIPSIQPVHNTTTQTISSSSLTSSTHSSTPTTTIRSTVPSTKYTTTLPTTSQSTHYTTHAITQKTTHSSQNLTPHPAVCKLSNTDICFIVDVTAHGGMVNYMELLKFVDGVINAIDFSGSHSTRICVLSLSDNANIEIHLDTYTTKQQIMQAILNIHTRTGQAHTAHGLGMVATEFHHHHRQSRRIMILLMDSKSIAVGNNLAKGANHLHHMGIETYAVGVGPHVDSFDIHTVASDANHAFIANTYNDFDDIRYQLIGQLCICKFCQTSMSNPNT